MYGSKSKTDTSLIAFEGAAGMSLPGLKSLVFAVIMVPVVMAIILGLIYGLGEVFNIFSGVGKKDQPGQNH